MKAFIAGFLRFECNEGVKESNHKIFFQLDSLIQRYVCI